MKSRMGILHRSSFGHLSPVCRKFMRFCKGFSYTKICVFQYFNALIVVGSFICFLVIIGSGYCYSFPSSQTLVNHNGNSKVNITHDFRSEACNLSDGKWVMDEKYPLYNASECPFAEKGFNCLGNGRKDKGYLKWRWKPRHCEIPRFNARVALEMLRRKRVVFVGDSLSRTQWESMICMLMNGVEDKSSVFEINGNKITKQIRHLAVRFKSYELTIEFYRSIFLVQPGMAPRRSPKRVKAALKLDQLDDKSREWVDSDILVFNSGHWWTSTKLFELGWYFQIGGKMKLGMPINNALRTALATWQSWVDNEVNPNRTRVFFRTFESTHWSSGTRQSCKVTTHPLVDVKWKQSSSINDAIIHAVKTAKFPVKLLHVTSMGAFRSDAHVGDWSDNPSVPDCSHWCLPGVPDMWNELLLSFLLSK